MKQNSIMQADRSAQPDVRQTISWMPTAVATPATLTDAQLYQRCKYYGKQAKGWMRKFESLLPEVYRRRLYKRRGFAGIHEFAQKLAGMSRDKVDKILRLSRKLEDKPVLKQAFASGEVGYSKLNSFIHLVTPDNEQVWTTRAKTMPRVQLELRVREERSDREEVTPGGNSTGWELTGERCKAIRYRMMRDISFKVDPDTERELRALQSKLEQERGEKLSFGEVMQILIKREHTYLIEKAQRKKTANYCPDCVKKRADEAAQKSEITRAVPAEIRQMVLARQNYLCAGGNADFGRWGDTNESARVIVDRRADMVGDVNRDGSFDAMRASDSSGGSCTHPPTELHHLDGWALTKNHDPKRMRYLCKKHHAEIHAGDYRVWAYRSG